MNTANVAQQAQQPQPGLLQEIDVYTASVAYSEVEYTGCTLEEALFRVMHNEFEETVTWWVREVEHTHRSTSVTVVYEFPNASHDNPFSLRIHIWPRKMYIPVPAQAAGQARAEAAEEELRKAREQEPIAEIHFPPNNLPLEVFWYGVNPNYAVRIGVYAAPKPAAYGVDDATAQHIALAVYDYQNRISDEPLMHAINRILAKETHSITPEITDCKLHDAPVRQNTLLHCCERNVRELQAEVHALQLRLKQAADACSILQGEVKRMHAAYDELQRLHHAILAEGRDATEL